MPWLLALAALLAYEAYALRTGRVRTLSRLMYDASVAWPFLNTLVGFVVGGLLVHFFWHWCPAQGLGAG